MICCYEMRKGRGSCVEPSSLKNLGSMFDAEAIHAQIPSNIEPNYQRTWCNGHKTGHASFLSSYIAILPLVSPMYVLGLFERLDRLPTGGESIPLGDYRLRIEKLDQRRIACVHVERQAGA